MHPHYEKYRVVLRTTFSLIIKKNKFINFLGLSSLKRGRPRKSLKMTPEAIKKIVKR